MSTVDYLPIATGVGANVETQGAFVGSGHQTNGFSAGLAQSLQVNKCLRQSSVVIAALANLISQDLSISVLDDGNLAALILNLRLAMRGGPVLNTTPVIVNANTSGAQTLMSLPALPAGLLNVVGRTLRIRAHGQFTPINTTESFILGLNGNSVITIIAGSATTPHNWSADILITTMTPGLAGVSRVAVSVLAMSCPAPITAVDSVFPANILSQGGFDLTSALTFTLSATFSAASASNSAEQDYMLGQLVA